MPNALTSNVGGPGVNSHAEEKEITYIIDLFAEILFSAPEAVESTGEWAGIIYMKHLVDPISASTKIHVV